MTYFSKLPYTTYEITGSEVVVKDILKRSAFISEYRPYTDLYSSYTIKDGETPQTIANELYGASTFHWVVLLFNEIHNPYFDWPLNSLDLEKYCIDKYGPDMYETKHYEVEGSVVGRVKDYQQGVDWVPPTFLGQGLAVSFYDHETKLNDLKREIKLLRPELLGEFVRQFGESMNE